jgi:hypothetical protein
MDECLIDVGTVDICILLNVFSQKCIGITCLLMPYFFSNEIQFGVYLIYLFIYLVNLALKCLNHRASLSRLHHEMLFMIPSSVACMLHASY